MTTFGFRKRTLVIAGTLMLLIGFATLATAYQFRNDLRREYDRLIAYRPMSPEKLGDGDPAAQMILFHTGGIAEDEQGNVYITDRGATASTRPFQGSILWKIDPQGIAHAIAGTGHQGTPVDGAPALETDITSGEGLVLDPEGRPVFPDHQNDVVLRIEPTGRLSRIAGTGEKGYAGDGGPATDAKFDRPYDVAFDSHGDLYVVDEGNHVVRRIDAEGIVTTVAGNGTPGYSGDGGPATEAQLNEPYNIAFDAQGRMLIGDSANNAVRRVDENGVITTIAGTGEQGYSGDGGPATQATLNLPQEVLVAADGRIFIGDEHNNAIRVIGNDGTITTLIGDGQAGRAADGTPVAEARLNDPEGMIIRRDGTLLILDGRNFRVLAVDPAGTVHNFAGRGTAPIRPRHATAK